LQDEQGTALGRINTDDEPVPAFVHQMANASLFPPTAAFTSDAKGSPAGDPSVTMRLETPVLYFHVPKGQTAPLTLSVNVAFRGGWLTQYFPDAKAEIQDALVTAPFPPLSAKTFGKLAWHDLTLNSKQGALPDTNDHVWTAPRAVDSASVTAGTEREQFLFYRGVGHVDAPLRVVRKDKTLEIHPAAGALTIPELWLVDVLADGSVAFRSIPRTSPNDTCVTPSEFTPQDYSRQNLAALRAALHKALVADGLFDDEASALLNTWERSYFQNPGQRIFFMVPQTWTDAVLPLTVSVPAQVKRVMVGRIELVTPAQRILLHHMAQTSTSELKGVKEVTAAMTKLRNDPAKAAAYNALAGGHGNLEDLGVTVPPIYADFLALGRFRTALVLDSKESSLIGLSGSVSPYQMPGRALDSVGPSHQPAPGLRSGNLLDGERFWWRNVGGSLRTSVFSRDYGWLEHIRGQTPSPPAAPRTPLRNQNASMTYAAAAWETLRRSSRD
jgi:hypothetical protein